MNSRQIFQRLGKTMATPWHPVMQMFQQRLLGQQVIPHTLEFSLQLRIGHARAQLGLRRLNGLVHLLLQSILFPNLSSQTRCLMP